MELVPALAPVDPTAETSVTSEEWELLMLVDGRSSVRDLAARARLDLDGARRALERLAAKGLVSLGAPAGKGFGAVAERGAEMEAVPRSDRPPSPRPRVDHRPVRGPDVVDLRPKDRFRIVVVGTDNRFRSPILEAFLRALTSGLPVDVASAGVRNLGRATPPPEAIMLARRFGIDIASHRATPLSQMDLSGVDLVLGFEQTHLATALVYGGAPADRTFLVTEVGELLARVRDRPRPPAELVERARQLTHEAHRVRPDSPLRSSGRELPLRLPGSSVTSEGTAEELHRLASEIASALFGLPLLAP